MSNQSSYTTYETTINEDGRLTLPSAALEHLGIHAGDFVTVIAAEKGLMLVPTRLIMPEVAERIAQMLADEHMTINDLLAGLNEEGDKLFKEQYGHLLSG